VIVESDQRFSQAEGGWDKPYYAEEQAIPAQCVSMVNEPECNEENFVYDR
jgi:hypothetical protein